MFYTILIFAFDSSSYKSKTTDEIKRNIQAVNERIKTIRYCVHPNVNGLFIFFIKTSIKIMCNAKQNAAKNINESDFCISIF